MTFRRLVIPALAVILLGLSARVPADYQDGLEAYQNGDYETARREFEALAERGVVVAYTNLGYMYALGEGVEADIAEAARWFDRAARAGDVASQLTLGVMYFNGEGVEQDPIRAFAWLSLAGAAGRYDALDYLELIRDRLDGESLERANRLARHLLREHGDPELRKLLREGWLARRVDDETD